MKDTLPGLLFDSTYLKKGLDNCFGLAWERGHLARLFCLRCGRDARAPRKNYDLKWPG